jgi:hypothetical protein
MKTTFKDWLLQPNKIKDECQPFLKQAEGHPLYRGISTSLFKPFFKTKVTVVQKDRKPRDSAKFVHDLMDDWFMKNYGVKARSEGLFSTGKITAAKGYGQVAYVFPVGNFKYLWATMMNGETEHGVGDTLSASRRIQEKCLYSKKEDAPKITDIEMRKYAWHTDNLVAAIESGAEITILCDEVILVPVKQVPDYATFIKALQ